MKKNVGVMGTLMALSFVGFMALAPNADARRGADDPKPAPVCHPEDGGVQCQLEARRGADDPKPTPICHPEDGGTQCELEA